MEFSKIEWTDHTSNFWYGCTNVSPGCDFCYAETMMDTRYGRVKWGAGQDRRRSSENIWKAPFKWDREAAAAGQRRRVFTLSLGDFWDNQIPDFWRSDALDIIRRCRNLDWLILTKRPQNIKRMLPPDWGNGWAHVWLGCTVENMAEANRRLPHLLTVPAVVHFLSCEPMLEALDLLPWLSGVDWVIAGGETGRAPRMMEPVWARLLRDDCLNGDVPFFMKQMTKKAPIPADLLVRQFPSVTALTQAEGMLSARRYTEQTLSGSEFAAEAKP
jgi:protein gp37